VSFAHFYNIEGYTGTIVAGANIEILDNSVNVYTEGVITNDSTLAEIACYVNTADKPAILKPAESLDFNFTIQNILLVNLSGTALASYRVFLKRRVDEYIA